MVDIEKIILALDEELLTQKKPYLTLRHANKILLEKGIFQESDLLSKTLLGLLEENKLPNAYQTTHKPRQWCIIHSGNDNNFNVGRNKDPHLTEKMSETDTGKKYAFCPVCGNQIEIRENLKTNIFLKCHVCLNIFHNPFKNNLQFASPFWTKIKFFFDKHGIKVVIGLALLVICSMIFVKVNRPSENRFGDSLAMTVEEKRIEKLKSLASDFLNENESTRQWDIFLSLTAAEDSNYNDIDVNIDMYHQDLPKNGMLIYSSKIFIPSSRLYAKKNPVYGLPVSFFYKFYFDQKDSLTAKYLVVVYNAEKTINYDFKISAVNLLLNMRIAKSKIDRWNKQKNHLAAQQQQEQIDLSKKKVDFDQKQVAKTTNICKKEKDYITSVYKMLMENINDLEYQSQRLPYEELARYIHTWNKNANEIRTRFRQSDFNCFLAFDFNVMLSSYQQAGLEFIKVLDGRDEGDYSIFKSRVTFNFKRLMDSYTGNFLY